MKILLLYQTPWWNATAYYGVILGKGLNDAGHDVWFGCKDKAAAVSKAKLAGLNLLDINLKETNPFKVLSEVKKLADFIQNNNIDVVNTLSPEGHLYHAIGTIFYGIKAPLVRSCCDVREPNGHFLNKYLYNKKVSKIIFPCHSNMVRYSKLLDFSIDKTEIIYGAIDLKVFDKDKPARFLRKKYNIPNDAFIIGNAARLSPEKGHEFFLEIASIIIAKVPNTYFVIMGKEQQISIESLQKIAESYNILDKVIFTGFVEDPRSGIADFDIGLIASRFSETISRAALEFMASNTVTISTNVNALGEILDFGKNGTAFDINDIQGMADAVIELLQNKEKLNKLKKSARKTVEDYYDLPIMVEKTVKIYKSVL